MDYKKYVRDKKSHPLYDAPLQQPENAPQERQYLGVKFECCGSYTRAYKNKEGTAYLARCPRCMKKVTIGINAQEGVSARFFTVKSS
jgi:hypothetical protein